MADLESIAFNDINRGATRATSNELASAIDNTLQVGAAVRTDAVTSDLGDETRDVLGSALREAESRRDAEPQIEASDTGDDILNSFIDEMSVHKARISQNSGARKARAEIAAQQVLQDFTSRHPSLRRELAAESGLVQRASSELSILGLFDSAATADTVSQDYREDIEHEAYTNLGIDRRLRFGTEEFGREYIERSAYRQRAVTNQLHLNAFNTDDAVDVRPVSNAYARTLQGSANTLALNLQNIAGPEIAQVREELSKGSGANPQIIDNFNNVIRPRVSQELESTKLAMLNEFNETWHQRFRDTSEFTQAKAMFDDTMAYLSEYEKALTANDQTGLAFLDAQQKLRQHDLRRKDPIFGALVDWVQAGGGEIFEMVEGNLNGKDKILMHKVAGPALEVARRNLLGGDGIAQMYLLSTQGALNSSATPAQIRAELARNHNASPAPTGDLTDGSDEQELANAHQAILNQAQRAAFTKEPYVLSQLADGMTGLFDVYSLHGNPAPDQAERSLEILGGPTVPHLTSNITPDGTYNSSLEGLGLASRDFYADHSKPERRLADNAQRLNESFPNLFGFPSPFSSDRIGDYLKVEGVEEIKKSGNFTLVVDEARLQKDFPKDWRQRANSIQSTAQEISASVTREIRTVAHIDALLDKSDNPSYALALFQTKYGQLFGIDQSGL